MVNFLDKLTGRRPQDEDPGRSVQVRNSSKPLTPASTRRTDVRQQSPRAMDGKIPNASIVYGLASAALTVFSLYLIIGIGNWFTGLLILLPAAILFAYAFYFIRYQPK